MTELKDLAGALLVALVALVIYHTGTYGRRGRRWGRQ